MLSLGSWLPLALQLDLASGRSRRVNHDCGDGRTLLLSRDDNKLKAYCFRCNDSGFHKIEESLEERIQRLSLRKSADDSLRRESPTGAVPDGLTDPSGWPVAARLWFARAGLHSGDIGALGARYDPGTGRVILPTGGGFWQGRAIERGQQPKYIAPDVAKVYPRYGQADRITLTEDILSAYKVGKVSEGWCMLGTSLPPSMLVALMQSGKGVNVWLDNDLPPVHTVNRGQIAAAKVLKQLRSAGIASVRNIVTRADPKLIHLEEIKELVT